MKICFIGQGKEICDLIKNARASGHDVVALLTYPKEEHVRDSQEHDCEKKFGLYESVFDLGKNSGLNIIESSDFNQTEVIEIVKTLTPDIFISWRSRCILKAPFLNQFEGKILNIHIGHLPHYRGSGAMSWMIMNGERQTALTYHLIRKGIDTGEIIRQFPIAIPENAIPIDIYKSASQLITEKTLDVAQDYLARKNQSIIQELDAGSYFPRLRTMIHGHVDFNWSPQEFERFVRAFSWPYAGAFFENDSKKYHIAHVKITDELPKYHTFLNGTIIKKNKEHNSIFVIVGRGMVEITRLRNNLEEIPAYPVFKIGSKLL